MRNLGLLSASVAVAAILAGCGGGGGGSSKQVTRTVAGFVYVLGGTGSASPNAVILPTATAPAGFFAPTSGSVTLSVPDGTISRSPDSEIFNMALSNAVICSVRAKEGTDITVSGSGLNFQGDPRSFSTFSVDIGVKANTNTVLVLNTGTSTYTPGPAVSLFYTVNGVVPTNAVQQFVAGDVASSLAVVSLDASGVIVTTLDYTVTATNAGVVVSGSPGAGPFDLTPAGTAQAEGLVDITIDDNNANLQATINGNFTHGTPTTVSLTGTSNTVLWGTIAPAVANTTSNLTATVTNEFGVAMPGVAVTFTNAKAPANTWAASPGTNYTAVVSPTNASGQATATFNPPDAVNAPIPGNAAKGLSVATATAGSASGTFNITVLRPIGALTIVGPSRLDTGTTSSSVVSGPQTYELTGATDVDGDAATIPAGTATWSVLNAAFSATVGNTGNTQAGSVSNSSINPTTGVVTAGTVAGQATVSATIGSVTSNNVVTQVFGTPSKIILNPDTTASVIVGATGEYLFANVGDTTNATFSLQDASGHVTPSGEYSGYTSTFSIQALTGGSITPGGLNVNAFTVTCGNTDGTFSVAITGSWIGALGGSGSINLNRDIGQNAP
jgi:hypothetical protein